MSHSTLYFALFTYFVSISRGVVQGDITSPIYFILALELILRDHDKLPNKGVQFGNRRIHTLGYADDAALIDETPENATIRVTNIAKGSRDDADMVINIAKTEFFSNCFD